MAHEFNKKQFTLIFGTLLTIEALFMLLPVVIAIIYHEDDIWCVLSSALVTAAFGIAGILYGRKSNQQIGIRESYLLVGLVWIIFSIFGMLPFVLSDSITTITDAYFETMSGFTTTGATIITDIDHMPKCLLFWRCLMQWIGGMGIMVFSMAVLPLFGSGMQLYKAEVTGPTYDKIQPRIKDTARRLWDIYIVLTLAQVGMLMLAGMNWFDSVCQSLSTMATGGFSTKQASIGYWSSPLIHYIIIVFMIISSINFTLLYNATIRHRFKVLFTDEEFRTMLRVIGVVTIYCFIGLVIDTQASSGQGFESCFRNSLFHSISIVTTTGFCTTDYLTWPPALWVILFLLTCAGGCAGSTSGGIKIIRLRIAFKNILYEFKRVIHPKAIIPVRINHRVVPENIINNVHAFLAIFIIIAVFSTIVLIALGMTPVNAFGAAVSCLSNVGPALGDLGPAGTYVSVPDAGKWILSFLMLVGRLELFTILLLFSPGFWKRN